MPQSSVYPCSSGATLLGLCSVILGGSLIALAPSALAIDTVELRYQDRSANVPLTDIAEFAETGVASPALDSVILRDGTVANLVGRVLTEEITFTGQLREELLERLESSSLGQFVVFQLGKFIQEREGDAGSLRTAIRASLEDNQISILEVLENYPASSSVVTLDLTQVGVVYRDVEQFVERVIPAVEAAREFLQDVICNCETTSPTPGDDSTQSQIETTTPVAALDCIPSVSPAESSSAIQRSDRP